MTETAKLNGRMLAESTTLKQLRKVLKLESMTRLLCIAPQVKVIVYGVVWFACMGVFVIACVLELCVENTVLQLCTHLNQ